MPGCCCRSNPLPSGPAIILVAAGLYVVSLLFGPVGGLVRQLFPSVIWKRESDAAIVRACLFSR